MDLPLKLAKGATTALNARPAGDLAVPSQRCVAVFGINHPNRQHPLPPSHRTNLVLLSAISHHSSAAWLQVLTHSSSSFRSQAMHPPPPEHWPPSEGRDWRGRKAMEETMRVLILTELMRLSKIELCDLLARITNALPDFPEGSVERANALLNLGNIRWILARRDFSP